MVSSTLSLFGLLSAVAVGAVAVPTADEVVTTAGIPGYGIEVIEWKVQATPDGPSILVNGTVQDVVAALNDINPGYRSKLDTTIAEELAKRSAAAELEARDKRWDYESHFCFGRWEGADRDAIWAGMEYLKGVKGVPTNGPGPGNCGRVSCSYQSAIWWCNDNTRSFSLNSFSDIATGARQISDDCWHYQDNHHTTGGQYFYKQKWNVIVRKDTDKC